MDYLSKDEFVKLLQDDYRAAQIRASIVLSACRRGVSSSAARRLPAINGTRQARALERARAIAPILSELAGMSARSVGWAELNARQVETPSGAPWSAKTVIRARERLAV